MGNFSLFSLNRNVLTEEKTLFMDQLSGNVSYSLNLEASVAVSTMSILNFSILIILLAYYYFHDDDEISSFGSPNNLILMFIGLVMSATTTLSIPKYDGKIYHLYLIITVMLVGVLVTVIGSRLFFKVPKKSENGKPIGYQHENISFIIWIITIPLILMELLEFIGAIAYKPDDYKYKATVDIIELSQKLIQASVYHFSLRYKVPRKDKKEGGKWYLRILSLFNFAMWLDAMISTNNESIEHIFGKGFSVISTAMVALLIDYHLLCCMVFAEHSMEVDEEGEDESVGLYSHVSVVDESKFQLCIRQYSGLGYVFGIVILSLQLVCGLQNYGIVGVWSNVFSIVADVLVVILGLVLIRLDSSQKNKKGQWRKSDAKGMDMMVALMGVCGLLYWIIMTVFNAAWISRVDILDNQSISYLKWCCAKNVFRSIGIIFQLCIFIKCDPLFGRRVNVRENPHVHFILPALMASFLSVFIMAVMDGHTKIVEELIESSGISSILITLIKVSEPLYLGYTLHLFLHFYIVYSHTKLLEVRLEKGLELNPLVT